MCTPSNPKQCVPPPTTRPTIIVELAAGGQLYDYRRSCCWGRDTLLGVRGGTHHGSRRVADRIEIVLGPQCDRLLRFDAGPAWVAGCRAILSDRTGRSRLPARRPCRWP